MPVNKDFYTLAGSSGQSTGYTIDQSIRFSHDNSAYMNRTVGSGGNTKTWSYSVWFKIGQIGSTRSHQNFLWSCHQSDTNRLQLGFDNGSLGNAGDELSIYNNTGSGSTIFRTTRVFRDPSAWYHLVLVADTSNSNATDRFRVYLNGERETSFSTFNAPSLNADLGWNQNGNTYYIGDYFSTHDGTYSFDGYMAEINHVDGYAYGPEYFGEFEDNGIWIPKEYTGSYGTKGFHIDGRDSSDLGDDESGNGNDFTTNNIATTDKRTDSPTNNHATWNQLVNSTPAFANGNIDVAFAPASSTKWAKTVMNFTLPNTGTWYWEGQEFNNVINPATAVGIVDSDIENLADKVVGNRFSSPMGTFTGIVVYSGPGQSIDSYTYKNGSNISTSATPILSTSRLGFLWEPENNRFTIYDDGSQYIQFTSVDTGNYVFGVNQATGTNLYFRLFVEANDWTQTPSGITSLNALNTKNIGS